MEILFGLQVAAHAMSFPQAMMSTLLLEYYNELDCIDEEAVKKWAADRRFEDEYAGHSLAVEQAQDVLKQLEEEAEA
jgi:hypothetical protein